MENKNDNFIGNQNPLSSSGSEQGVPILQKIKKPKLRWKSAITIFLFIAILVYFLSDYFGNRYLSSNDMGGFLSSEVGNFLSTIIFLGIVFMWPFLASVKMVETKIINGREIKDGDILKNTYIIASGLMALGFVYIFTLGVQLLVFGGPIFFLIVVMMSFLASFLFGFIPAFIFQREYRYDKLSRIEKISKVALIVSILFSLITIGHFVASQKTCGFYTVGYCLGRKAAETSNPNLCEKITIREGVTNSYDIDECYKHVAYVSEDASFCNKIKDDAIIDICLDDMAYITKNINLCLDVSGAKRKNECLTSFLRDRSECGKIKDESLKYGCILTLLEKEEKLNLKALGHEEPQYSSWPKFSGTSLPHEKMKMDFEFRYPSEWMIGSHGGAGGKFAHVSFYDKKVEKIQECDNHTCRDVGKMAEMQIGKLPTDLKKKEYNEERTEEIIIDGYQGIKSVGFVKNETEENRWLHIGEINQKEFRVIIPDLNGNYFEFIMLAEQEDDEKIFDEILKTFKFR